MTILKQNVKAVDIVVVILSLSALYKHFFTDDQSAALFLTVSALFFCGVAFIVDAIDRNKPISITTNETTLITAGKATIQE
jgi:hypothetical protein